MTAQRPPLAPGLDANTFLRYYYLKEELAAFLRGAGLSASGAKSVLTERVAAYLATGEVVRAEPVPRAKPESVGEIAEDTLIEANFVCSEKHRAYFKGKIGPSFTFPVAFQKWLKANTGKTYAEAVQAYYRILEERKRAPKIIDPQFEYNAYIRDFFADNAGRSLRDAIACWNYKKSLPGHDKYERSDLAALGGRE